MLSTSLSRAHTALSRADLVAYMLLTELEDASQDKLVTWGVLLLLVNLGTVLLAIFLQITESNRQIVLQLVRPVLSHPLASLTTLTLYRCFSSVKSATLKC